MFCKQCGSELKQGTNFCTMCGLATTCPTPQANTNTANNESSKLMELHCLGKTTLHTQMLTIYSDHIVLMTDKILGHNDVIFNVNYHDLKCCVKKSNSKLQVNRFCLEQKNGNILEFALDIRYTPEGKYHSWNNAYNPALEKLYKTLPDYINNLIANYNA